jgi:uncharacterized protein
MSCVNAVGVELNTASAALLGYVSGLGPALAGNIVAWRDEHGPFAIRQSLMDVPRLGAKAFVQAAGFLRIRDGVNPLDASAVHPESYPVVEKMADDLGCAVVDLMREEALRQKIDIMKYVSEDIGLPTLNDILAELAKPGRDPRTRLEEFHFAEGIAKVEDLVPGMKLPGIVTNLTAFGAFVDIGVHQDGLIHTSQLADRFVKDPADVLKVNQALEVTVLAVDLERRRISLTLKKNQENAAKRPIDRASQEAISREKPLEKPEKSGGGSRESFPPRVKKADSHPARDKKGDKKPPRDKKDEKIPFNNPFAAVFGKKQ